MNLFSGMSPGQIWSAVVMIGTFTAYAGLVTIALIAFYVTSRPGRDGRIRSVAGWQLAALFFFFWALVAMVWSAQSEFTFVKPGTTQFVFDVTYQRTATFLWSVAFAIVGLVLMVAGIASASAARKRERQGALSLG